MPTSHRLHTALILTKHGKYCTGHRHTGKRLVGPYQEVDPASELYEPLFLIE